MGCSRGRGLVENEEQDENKTMKSIVVEEQEEEQEEEEGSETRFVDLDKDTLRNVLGRVDVVTLGRAACVNKLWREVAEDDRLRDRTYVRFRRPTLIEFGEPTHLGDMLWYFDGYRTETGWVRVFRPIGKISDIVKTPPDFYSIDFSKKIRPWR